MLPSHPPPMMRLCTNPVGFVERHGLDSYFKQYNPVVTPEMYEAELYYQENYGPRVTKEHICAYIRYWGIEHYITNCSPESTYDSVAMDADFMEAQLTFYSKPIDEMSEFRIARMIRDPYHRKIRDAKGTLVPEPTETTDVEYEVDKDYIYTHGIVNYVLYSGIKIPLSALIASRSIAIWQRCYIDSL